MIKKTKAKESSAAKAKEKKPVTKAKPAPAKKAPVVEKAATKAKVEAKPVVQKVESKKVEPKKEPVVASVKGAEKPVREEVAVPAPEKKKPVLHPGISPLAHAVGRRKTAVARVWFSRGTGKIMVNDKNYADYFDTEIMRLDAALPFRVCQVSGRYDVRAMVQGGGLGAQAGAVRLGISRALVSLHEETRSTLRQFGLLTVDSRRKERKKYGQKAARRKFQFVKR